MPENSRPDKKQIHHPHDKGYKQLLSNKKTFLELIRTFVREDWVSDINENDLILVDKSYILQDFSEKEADIVYRLKTREGDVIFYVLLELQSTVDYPMPFRLLLYQAEIWRDIYNNTPKDERERRDFRLPVIIPAVLYNGANIWTARLDFKEILAGYRKFEKHTLNFRYILFDVNRYSEEELYKTANLVSGIFVLDQTMDHRELTKRLRKLIDVLKRLTPEEFQQIMTWLKNVIKPKMPEHLQKEVDRIMDASNPMEVEIMIMNLEITLDEMQRQAEARGIDKGEMKAKMETAKAAMLEGFEVDVVAKITGLTKETILKLKNELN